MTDLTARQRQVLEFIDAEVRRRGYPPSVREIGEAVGLSSSSTVHAHLGVDELEHLALSGGQVGHGRALRFGSITWAGSARMLFCGLRPHADAI